MEPILVPGPPKTAYDKNRRVSDLIRAQVAHCKHLEQKLPPGVRATLPQHRIVTEDDAARYIAPFTRLLRRGAPAAPTAAAQPASALPARPPVTLPQRAAQPEDQLLELAAAATPATPSRPKAAPRAPKTQPASAAKKASPGKGTK